MSKYFEINSVHSPYSKTGIKTGMVSSLDWSKNYDPSKVFLPLSEKGEIYVKKADAQTLVGRPLKGEQEYLEIFLQSGTPLMLQTINGSQALVFNTQALTTPYTLVGTFAPTELGTYGQASNYGYVDPQSINDSASEYVIIRNVRQTFLVNKDINFHARVGQNAVDPAKFAYVKKADGTFADATEADISKSAYATSYYGTFDGIATESTLSSVIPRRLDYVQLGLAGNSAQTSPVAPHTDFRWYVSKLGSAPSVPAGGGLVQITSDYGISQDPSNHVKAEATLIAQIKRI